VVISPWNFPIAILTGMAAAALVTGNPVILKPAEQTPACAYHVFRLFLEAGVPETVVHFLPGRGEVVGARLVAHPDVATIAFTGSREVGSLIARRAAETSTGVVGIKRVIAEMGGKNATVVTKRADLDKASTGVLKSAFGFSGQKCSATSRVYVQEDAYDAFVAKLVEKTKKLKVDLPWKKDADMGPVINEAAVKTFLGAVDAAKKAGGQVLAGGNVVKHGGLDKGHFVEPTVVAGLPPGHEAFRSEYFVPFVAVAKFRDNDEVVREVNAADYGLTFGVFAGDAAEAQWFFDRIEAGVVYANRERGSSTGAMVGGQSFGGWKFSGTTDRGAGGPWYLLQFLREQSRTYAGNLVPPGGK
jgi:1-pyrroline-5-carboxylate dehydrogenase